MTDIKMSDVFDNPLDLRLTEMGQVYCRFNLISDEALEYIEDATKAYDANQERIKELEAALLKLIDVANLCDGWESFPSDSIDEAIAVSIGNKE